MSQNLLQDLTKKVNPVVANQQEEDNLQSNMMKHANLNKILPLLMLTTGLWAQSAGDAIHILEYEYGFGPKALSMGGAFTAIADNYSAVYWNPAGLGQITESQFFTELQHSTIPNSANYMGKTTLFEQNYMGLKSAGLVFPVPTTRGSFVFALGYHQIKNFNENLLFSGFSTESNGLDFEIENENGTVAFHLFDKNVDRNEQVTSEGGINQWSLGASLAVSSRLLVGMTFSLVTGRETYHFKFNQVDTKNRFTTYPADFDEYTINQHLQSDLSGINLKLGGLLKLTNTLSLGTVITLPASLNIEELYSYQDELVFDDGFSDSSLEDGNWDYTIKSPMQLDGGIALRTRMITLSAAARYRNWSQVKFIVNGNQFGDEDYLEYLEENDVIRNTYKPVTEIRLGVELPLRVIRTTLRGGYSLIPDKVVNSSSSGDRHTISGGFSYAIDRNINFDITMIKDNWEQTSSDIYTPGNTVETINRTKIQVGASFNF